MADDIPPLKIHKPGDPARIAPTRFIGKCSCCGCIVECDRTMIHDFDWQDNPMGERGRAIAKLHCPTIGCGRTIPMCEISEVSDMTWLETELGYSINGSIERHSEMLRKHAYRKK